MVGLCFDYSMSNTVVGMLRSTRPSIVVLRSLTKPIDFLKETRLVPFVK